MFRIALLNKQIKEYTGGVIKLQIMNWKKYLYLGFSICFLMKTSLWSQFIELNAELDMRRLSEGDRQLFETLSEDIKSYYLNTQFAADIDDLGIIIDCRLVLESISRGGSQTSINAQAIFVNKQKQIDGKMKTMDQYFYAKAVQFPYERGRKMYYTSKFDPLASFLDFYAFMFIATELDTYEYMGGTSFFNRAIELADLGKDSNWSNGWENRWKKARKLKGNEYLRSIRYNFFIAWDEYKYSDELNINFVKTYMYAFYEDFEALDRKYGSNKETLHFLDSYHENIAELLSALKMIDALNLLILYDHDHKELYESYLKN